MKARRATLRIIEISIVTALAIAGCSGTVLEVPTLTPTLIAIPPSETPLSTATIPPTIIPSPTETSTPEAPKYPDTVTIPPLTAQSIEAKKEALKQLQSDENVKRAMDQMSTTITQILVNHGVDPSTFELVQFADGDHWGVYARDKGGDLSIKQIYFFETNDDPVNNPDGWKLVQDLSLYQDSVINNRPLDQYTPVLLRIPPELYRTDLDVVNYDGWNIVVAYDNSNGYPKAWFDAEHDNWISLPDNKIVPKTDEISNLEKIISLELPPIKDGKVAILSDFLETSIQIDPNHPEFKELLWKQIILSLFLNPVDKKEYTAEIIGPNPTIDKLIDYLKKNNGDLPLITKNGNMWQVLGKNIQPDFTNVVPDQLLESKIPKDLLLHTDKIFILPITPEIYQKNQASIDNILNNTLIGPPIIVYNDPIQFYAIRITEKGEILIVIGGKIVDDSGVGVSLGQNKDGNIDPQTEAIFASQMLNLFLYYMTKWENGRCLMWGSGCIFNGSNMPDEYSLQYFVP